MGNKAHPNSLQLLVKRNWQNIWFSEKAYPQYLLQDLEIRKYLKRKLKNLAVSQLYIRRFIGKVEVEIHTAKSGIVIGSNGSEINVHRDYLTKLLGKPVFITVVSEKNPEKSASILAQNICQQLEKRFPFRRAMKSAVQWAMKAGALGIKVQCAGRLGGVEIARTEWYLEGNVPRSSFRADIDYCFEEADTIYGKIGVKVWVYTGQTHKRDLKLSSVTPAPVRTEGA